jgi:hypothetical protein
MRTFTKRLFQWRWQPKLSKLGQHSFFDLVQKLSDNSHSYYLFDKWMHGCGCIRNREKTSGVNVDFTYSSPYPYPQLSKNQVLMNISTSRSYHSSGSLSPSSHLGDLGSIPLRICSEQNSSVAGFLQVLRSPLSILIPPTTPYYHHHHHNLAPTPARGLGTLN